MAKKAAPVIESVTEMYDKKTRLDVYGLPAELKARWVRNDNVERRKSMGYEVYSGDDVKTNTGGREGAKHAMHDMVLMVTRKDRADAYLKACAEKSRARVRRDVEAARESLSRATGRKYFGGVDLHKG